MGASVLVRRQAAEMPGVQALSRLGLCHTTAGRAAGGINLGGALKHAVVSGAELRGSVLPAGRG
jgi:hypothetical protein